MTSPKKIVVPRGYYVTLKRKGNGPSPAEEYGIVDKVGENVKNLVAGEEVLLERDARIYKIEGHEVVLVSDLDIIGKVETKK